MASLSEDRFQELLDDLWDEVNKYEAKFGDGFEICFLVSGAVQAFKSPTMLSTYVIRDPFDCYTYLLGRRVIFTDQEYIPSFTSSVGLFKPVICCKDPYSFPMTAEPGDYVMYAGHLKQVIGITLEDGDRAVNIRDVPGAISDSAYAYANTSDKLVDEWLHYKRRKDQERDTWMKGVDNAEINNYLSSLNINSGNCSE